MGTDTLSMEIPKSYFNLFGKSDQTILQVIAEALLKIQYALGDFNHIYGKGDLSSVCLFLYSQLSILLELKIMIKVMSIEKVFIIFL